MISSFSVFAPPLMGYGASDIIGEKCRDLGLTKVILVHDLGVEKAGLSQRIEKSLKNAGVEYVSFKEIEPDPTDVSIEAGARFAQQSGGIKAVIGLGGGSSLDTAKGINVLMGNPFPLSDYFLGGKPTQKGLPLFLIPTTAGTGSECTQSCIVSDTKNKRKTTIRSSNCNVATLAIIDPALTLDLPPSLTAITGIDAFAHAAESLTGNKTNPVSDALNKESLRLISKNLPIAFKDGHNREARESALLAAMMAGMGFTNSMCHLGHSFGHAIGAIAHIPHGLAIGSSIAQAICFVADATPERVKAIGECMGLTFPSGVSAEEIGRRTGEAILKLKADINLPELKSLNVTREQIIAAHPLIPKDGCYPFAVKTMTEEQIKEYLGKMYDNVL
ncbi:MAG: iron-containing alcohol dehydrogenase [Candidatus Adiutrix sp.]|jgi:alcohol dehydrogenase|nr:iron-containing alcohol dehydrogenase [Candidatus Adiutrix sp.]